MHASRFGHSAIRLHSLWTRHPGPECSPDPMLARSAKPNKQQTRTHARTHRDTHTQRHAHTHTHPCPTIEAAALPVVRCCLVVDESTAPVMSREQQAFLALALDEVRRGIQQLADPKAPYKTPDKTATAHTAILHDTAASG